MLQDRSGGTVQQLSETMDKLALAARKRPELASLVTTFRPTVPQLFVNVDQDRVLKQGLQFGESLSDASGLPGRRLRQPIQSFRAAVKV